MGVVTSSRRVQAVLTRGQVRGPARSWVPGGMGEFGPEACQPKPFRPTAYRRRRCVGAGPGSPRFIADAPGTKLCRR